MTSSRKPIWSDEPRLTIVADDLTGACDAAVPFAERGLRTIVVLGELTPDAVGAQVIALSTETRDIAPETLPEQLIQHLKPLTEHRSCGILFKKIDSALRGNTSAEIAILAHMLSPRILAVAPAFPALGRRMRNGVQRIGDGTAQHSVDVNEALRRAGVETQRFDVGISWAELGAGAIAAAKAGRRVLLFDAETQDDLEAVVGALSPMENEVLWVGSGGLAHALAGVLPEPVSPDVKTRRTGKAIFVIGSDHPVTQLQLEELRADHEVAECGSADCCPSAKVVVCRVGRGAALKETAAFFSHMDPARIGCILVTGGDTAMHLCRALEVGAIELQREFARGVPAGIIRGGAMDGVSILTKSGGFGDRDLLSRVAAEYSKEAGVAR